MSVTLYQIQRQGCTNQGRLVALVAECGLAVPKYFWVVSMELLVTFLDTKNFEVASGLFENLRTPRLRHWILFLKKKIILYKSCLTFPVLSHIHPLTNRAVCKVINGFSLVQYFVSHSTFSLAIRYFVYCSLEMRILF
jgi:hypothetical protein